MFIIYELRWTSKYHSGFNDKKNGLIWKLEEEEEEEEEACSCFFLTLLHTLVLHI